ncbi:TPA: hypothetical protein JD349_26800, partial [Serratia marcescens]|nr:hypothetical protein [Serratia marcescens]HAU5758622.1 hypothetical protein [Serratia marcescens]
WLYCNYRIDITVRTPYTRINTIIHCRIIFNASKLAVSNTVICTCQIFCQYSILAVNMEFI